MPSSARTKYCAMRMRASARLCSSVFLLLYFRRFGLLHRLQSQAFGPPLRTTPAPFLGVTDQLRLQRMLLDIVNCLLQMILIAGGAIEVVLVPQLPTSL